MLKTTERLLTFSDPALASIERLRCDMRENGTIRPEIWQRVIDEEMSLIAEGLRGDVTTSFDFTYSENALRAADGESFMSIAQKGVDYFYEKSRQDDRYEFAYKRACHEYAEALLAERLASGEIKAQTILTVSPYPQEAADTYGTAFIQSLGYHPKRKAALVRAIEKTSSGVRMHSRIIEGSDLQRWNTICFNEKVSTTDDALAHQLYYNEPASIVLDTIENHYSPRNEKDSENAWEFLKNQKELSEHYFLEIEKLSNSNLEGDQLKSALNTLRYNYWSAIRLRKDSANNQYLNNAAPGDVMQQAGREMQSRREVFASCGMNVVPINKMNQEQMQQEIFGQGIRSCVSCPFCKKTVSARFSAAKKTIECLNKNCGAKVDRNGKRIDKAKTKTANKTFGDFVIEIFMSLQADKN